MTGIVISVPVFSTVKVPLEMEEISPVTLAIEIASCFSGVVALLLDCDKVVSLVTTDDRGSAVGTTSSMVDVFDVSVVSVNKDDMEFIVPDSVGTGVGPTRLALSAEDTTKRLDEQEDG